MQTDNGQKSWASQPNNHHICRDQCEKWTLNSELPLSNRSANVAVQLAFWQLSTGDAKATSGWTAGLSVNHLSHNLALPGLRRAHCSLQISTYICSDVQTYVIYIGFTTEEISPCPRVPDGRQDVDGAQLMLLLHHVPVSAPRCQCHGLAASPSCWACTDGKRQTEERIESWWTV